MTIIQFINDPYFKCSVGAGIGIAIAILGAMKQLRAKCKKCNIAFHPSEYFYDDWYNPIISILVVTLFLMAAHLRNQPPFLGVTFIDLRIIVFSTIGYSGSDIIFKVYSAVNDRINDAVKFKAKESDAQSGTLDTPTPAAKTVK